MSLVCLDPDLEMALADGIVLVPSTRLAREVCLAHDTTMAERGHRGWATARVMTLESYAQRRFIAEHQDRQLLDDDVARAAMQTVAPSERLWPHVGLFASAWQLFHEWQLDANRESIAGTANGRAFLRWVGRFAEACRETGWVTRPQLWGQLADATAPRTNVYLWPTEDLPPAQSRFVEQLHARTLPARPLADASRARVVAAAGDSQEIALAAAWARRQVARNPGAEIGVAVPGLNARLAAVVRQFQAAFDDIESLGGYINFGGGAPLIEEPSCHAAFEFLTWCDRARHWRDVEAMATVGCFSRSTLALPLSPQLPAAFDARTYARHSPGPTMSRITAALDSAAARAAPSSWGVHFRELLELGGWLAGDVESHRFQGRRTLFEVLDGLSRYDSVIHRCDRERALTLLLGAARQRLFATATERGAIQVLSPADAADYRFDSLWVVGMQDTAWPGHPDWNPFIPRSVQIGAGVPRVDADAEWRYAEQLTRRWRGAAAEVVFSFAAQQDNREYSVSSLLADLDSVAIEALIDQSEIVRYGHPHMAGASASDHSEPLETYRDEPAPALLPPYAAAGGATLLRDQAACPFRAFAVHRLGLREAASPHSFPDAGDRGVVVHEVAAQLSQQICEASLAAVDEAAMQAAVARGIADHGRLWPPLFRVREVQRLKQIIASWIDLEKRRPPFSVVAIEQPVTVDIDGMTLSLRMDRVDRDAEGRTWVVDFKTGVVRAADWAPPRPREPQLPLYATLEDDVAAVLVVRLGADGARFIGVGDQTATVPGMTGTAALGAEDMNMLLEAWRTALSALATEFLSGNVRVEPQSTDVCRQCHLSSLCRVYSR